MRIGFDAKRAFFNFSGLGNYSRNIIAYLSRTFPEHEYFLYIPKRNTRIRQNGEFAGHTHVYPEGPAKYFPSLWRSYRLGRRLEKDGINLYHGLSNEIPFDLPGSAVRSVVTMHDLIFMRFPQWYQPIDRRIYIRKARHACLNADRIVAISRQTGSDLQEFLRTPAEKIDVVYQGCDPMFYSIVQDDRRQDLRDRYSLPASYLLYVGTIEPRKNLLTILKAMLAGSPDIPLVVIGRPTAYLNRVRRFIREHDMKNVRFLRNVPNEDLPGLYQMAEIFLYPSIFEGFGIPILEALASRTPVITSRGSCFPEAGGKSTLYVDPGNPEELADAIRKILEDSGLQDAMRTSGYEHALGFTEDIIAGHIMNVYRKIL